MSKPIQFLPLGYYPISLQTPVLESNPNPVQRYVQVWEQFYTSASILPPDLQLLPPTPVLTATQVAQSAFRQYPSSVLPVHSEPTRPLAATLNVPVPPQRPSAPGPAAALPVPVDQSAAIRRKRDRSPQVQEKITFIQAREQSFLPTATEVSAPHFTMDKATLIRTLLHDGAELLKQRKYLEAIQCFRQGFLKEPSYHTLYYFLTESQKIIGEIRPEVLKYVEDALSYNRKDINALFLKGLCYIGPGKYQIALTCFASILRISPTDQMVTVLYNEVRRMFYRDTQSPQEEYEAQQVSVRKKMAISALLNPLNPVTG